MTRIARRILFAAALLLPGSLLLAGAPTCTGASRVTWPSVSPVWDFCWTRPGNSSGANGSGVELTQVHYNGVLVIGRAHIPILNVKYASGCGGTNLCYRDWLFSEQDFECSPCQDSSGAAVSCSSAAAVRCAGTTTAAATVCDHPGTDAGVFSGVAVEDLGTSLRLTSQTQAGWYRYIPVWEFFADGTLQANFDVTSVDHPCVSFSHYHHAYWRLDMDVNGPTGNYVDEVLSGGGTLRVTTEQRFDDTSPGRRKWRVGNAGSPYAVEVNRNPGDGAALDPFVVPNDFPMGDGWVLAYADNQVSDYPNLNVCPANIDPWDNNQSVDGADVVLWVRAGALHEAEPGGIADHCGTFGPTIRVLPLIPPPQPLAFHTLAPCRLFDTRQAPGPYGGPALAPGSPRSFGLAGQCGIPPGAKSVSVNLTAVAPGTAGYLVAYPSGGPVPASSVLNFGAGQTRANNAVLPLSAGGAVTLQNGAPGSVNVLMDVTGWFE